MCHCLVVVFDVGGVVLMCHCLVVVFDVVGGGVDVSLFSGGV